MINTYGKIVLENGQKVFKRFGAATKQKIKLGTAAFANIVNNATTTEEGFVPDARVVAQQQETIANLQAQISSLNSAIKNYEEFTLTLGEFGGTISRQQCYYNSILGKVHIFFEIRGLTDASGTAATIVKIPEKYKPKTEKYGIGVITSSSLNAQLIGTITVRISGAITQAITNAGFTVAIAVLDYYI